MTRGAHYRGKPPDCATATGLVEQAGVVFGTTLDELRCNRYYQADATHAQSSRIIAFIWTATPREANARVRAGPSELVGV